MATSMIYQNTNKKAELMSSRRIRSRIEIVAGKKRSMCTINFSPGHEDILLSGL